MSKTRTKANGEGTIYTQTRNNKKYYRGQIAIGYDEKGNLIRKSFSGYDKKDVLKRMNEYQYKMNTGLISEDDKITLQEWFYTWLFEFRKIDLKPSSFERYEGIYRNYIENSPIGKKKLADIRPAHIQKYMNTLLETKPISTVHTVSKFLSTCLNEAVKQNYIQKNHCKSIKLPKKVKEESFTVFTLDEQKQFIEGIKDHKYEMAFLLNLSTGLRLGELLALKWDDIDFTNNTLTINKSIKRVTFVDKEGKRNNRIIEQTPKTESSNRTVPIPDNIINKLKKYKVKQLETKLKNKEFYEEKNYIFCDKYGHPLDPKNIPRNFKSVLKKAGIREIKYHSLRHTYATRLFEADVPIKTVQSLLGHSDITTTMNIYTHVTKEKKSEAADKINNLFSVQ
ncbi:tyrosine-type recombinase/integrase [Senegalia massiliensis]|uniref:tyrosine-type recombinase/integrase n=1 Tax=Senegalia massiliensis TaxID=1720316 RepID=UPI0010312C39|nr:site-specific integrase [Senegalia massiliensis]